MSSVERVRTFLAVYRAGSVTAGARQRHISQPAASQQLAFLERALGAPLFVRTQGGVEPTTVGRDLFGKVAGPLDQLEQLLRSLDGGGIEAVDAPVRIGTTQEYFEARLLGILAMAAVPLSVRFGDGPELHALLGAGDVDIVVSPMSPRRKQHHALPTSLEGFALVVGSTLAPADPFSSLHEAGEWLSGRSWVAYSPELPVTRRFWSRSFGVPFSADLRLAAPDLRVVAAAVVKGLGASLLPRYVVDDKVADGSITELFELGDAVESEQWYATALSSDSRRRDVEVCLELLGEAAKSRASG